MAYNKGEGYFVCAFVKKLRSIGFIDGTLIEIHKP
jgi:hypothetical protein